MRISTRLLAKYPEEMTIVLQHQYRDLEVSEQAFEVGLHFGGVPERIFVPFNAVTAFGDPAVGFQLQFAPFAFLAVAFLARRPVGRRFEMDIAPAALAALGQQHDLLVFGQVGNVLAGVVIDDQRAPSVVALRKQELQVLDTWHTLGLRGTGSHDAVADEVFMPTDRVFSLFDGPIVDRPLYRFPVFGFFAAFSGFAAAPFCASPGGI